MQGPNRKISEKMPSSPLNFPHDKLAKEFTEVAEGFVNHVVSWPTGDIMDAFIETTDSFFDSP